MLDHPDAAVCPITHRFPVHLTKTGCTLLCLVLADKLQDRSVEDLRLFPVRRVAGLWHDDGFRAFDASRKESKHRWGRVQVGIAGEQERRNLDPLERGERDSVPR